ncbi:methyltransferase [Candidatus Nitrosocosmicus franklandus]|uniref:Multifunctional cyclase-dehydratase-3-O-methyl transferase TcmN n=1 Tax=Candidatus Nitrosocosmicus franklandianus TaxID=1798806 RepID=A0A484IJ78_9ARCH|nr:methyltransferase [Candidatus Nitrosocosmicus franklandus]VFJ14948.1 Multifunctional cyclase-dehydratase-3-O-methyl transferase TcmN [Candidatus Nitrosocosmicus franklandus]
MSEVDNTINIIFGRWKSQILYAGAKIGLFDYLTTNPTDVRQIAQDLNLNEAMTYRILRSIASLGYAKEEKNNRKFSITSYGELLKKDHPQTLQGVLLLEEGPEHYQVWKHLPQMIKDGKQNAFSLEYGIDLFEYTTKNSEYSKIFNDAMSSFSAAHTAMVLEALDNYDFSNISRICEIGGGQGHLSSHLYSKYNHLNGTILELTPVVENQKSSWIYKTGLQARCNYVEGNMFNQVPSAELYIMKMILHDWNDDECIQILSNIHKASPDKARIFIVEHIIPDASTPHFSKLFDIHMMCVTTGRERTIQEFDSILSKSGWKYIQSHYPRSKMIGIVEAIKKG